jgi:hypothetical protein
MLMLECLKILESINRSPPRFSHSQAKVCLRQWNPRTGIRVFALTLGMYFRS